jgi:hypothetical protein
MKNILGLFSNTKYFFIFFVVENQNTYYFLKFQNIFTTQEKKTERYVHIVFYLEKNGKIKIAKRQVIYSSSNIKFYIFKFHFGLHLLVLILLGLFFFLRYVWDLRYEETWLSFFRGTIKNNKKHIFLNFRKYNFCFKEINLTSSHLTHTTTLNTQVLYGFLSLVVMKKIK